MSNDKKYEVILARKPKKEYKYSAHGISLIEYIQNPDIELWLKVLAYIMNWYMTPKNASKAFYQKYDTIRKIFSKWGWECTNKGLEEAFRRLKADDLDLINVVYATEDKDFNYMTKAEWVAAGNNPKKYIYRRVFIKWARVKKYMSVFTGESHILKNLPSKHRLKKLIFKRFMSYTWTLQAMFDKQMKEANVEKYTSAHKMFYGFIFTYSSKYFNVKALIKNYIPDHAIDLQKEQDRQAYDEALGYLANELKKRGNDLLNPYKGNELVEAKNSLNNSSSIAKDFFNSIK